MPVPPRTWNDLTDYITATYLNGELRCYNGKEFTPTGAQFFARRPVYKSFNRSSAASVVADGTWTPAYAASIGGQQSSPVGDTAGLYGKWMDPYETGNINLRIEGGGGASGSQGGLILATGFALWPPFATGAYGAGFGNANGTTTSSDGTLQGGNSVNNGCAVAIDVLDGNNTNRWCLFGYNNSGGLAAPAATANLDGSGQASRLHAHWVSAYPGNGTTLTSVPTPIASVTSGSAMSATLLNSGVRDIFRLMNYPPLLRIQGAGGTFPLTAGQDNVVNFGAATYDTYGGWDNTSNTYTVPLSGLYLVHGVVNAQNFAGELRVGANINGTTYWGPRNIMPGTGEAGAAKTQIFSLVQGDKIRLSAWPSVAATGSSIHAPRMVVVRVASLGSPTLSTSVPNTTYRWQAGTPGPWDTLFNAHIANDVQFLARKPYLMTYQGTVQTGIAMNAATQVTMDTVGGLIHGDSGDNFSGWNASTKKYVAPVDGWYMAVWEIFLNNPSLTTNPWVSAAMQPTPHGITTWDTYQRQNMAVTFQYPGAMGLSHYYLKAGDTLTPGVVTGASSATTISTAVNAPVIQSHFELVWLGE